MAARGRLIALEGPEASGKSTQARLLAEALGAVLTREPGGTATGGRVRSLLLDSGASRIDARTEALLMLADRAQHVSEILEPALSSGRWVVTDRFSASLLAYQGFGRGLDVAELRRLTSWASGGLWPDLTVLLDVPPEQAAARQSRELDRLEREDGAFHQRVVGGYQALAAAERATWAVVDGSGAEAEVAGRVLAVVTERLGAPGGVTRPE
ncbi:MAG TPA: dTMP kinase [Acidimicrobiales bacterium]|jgi:dTMP kinase